MSGGSFNYLYSREPSEKLESLYRETQRLVDEIMRARETEVWQGVDKPKATATPEQRAACSEVAAELLAIEAMLRALAARAESLRNVLRAVEWSASGDWAADSTWEACAEWCAGRKPRGSIVDEAIKQTAEEAERTVLDVSTRAVMTLRALKGEASE